jgi:hypothetical protein
MPLLLSTQHNDISSDIAEGSFFSCLTVPKQHQLLHIEDGIADDTQKGEL